jgi:hypothetical protein
MKKGQIILSKGMGDFEKENFEHKNTNKREKL